MRGCRRDALIAFVRAVWPQMNTDFHGYRIKESENFRLSAIRVSSVSIRGGEINMIAVQTNLMRAESSARETGVGLKCSLSSGRTHGPSSARASFVDATPSSRALTMKATIELELKKIRRALNWFAVPVWKWDRAAPIKPL